MADTAIAKMASRKPSTRRALKDKNPSGNEANIEAGKVPESNPTTVQEVSVSDPGKENREILSRPRKSSKKPKAAAASKKEIKQTSTKLMKELMQEKLQKEIKQTSEVLMKEMQEKLQELKLEKEKAEELLKEKEEKLKLKHAELQQLEFKPTTMKAKEQEKKKADDSNNPNDTGASKSTPSIDDCAPKMPDAILGRPKRTIKRPNYLKDYYLK